jgi:hypothetical protein
MDTDEKDVAGERPSTSDRPKLLYKYLDRHGLDAIANLELRITPPNEFNDPLEFTPHFVATDECDYRAAYQLVRRDLLLASVPYDHFRQRFSIERNGKLIQSIWQHGASRFFRVLCLSSDPASVPMWAHYSAYHTGLVLGLKLDARPFCVLLDSVLSGCGNEPQLFREVRYCPPRERRIIRLSELYRALESGRGADDKFTEIFSTNASEKGGEWASEKEYRFVVPWPLNDHRLQQPPVTVRMVNGRMIFFLRIDAAAISRIIIGERASSEFEHGVREAAALRGIDGRIVRARIDRQRYTVEVDQI